MEKQPPIEYRFYMDDSGARCPRRHPTGPLKDPRDYFALGGILVAESDEPLVREAHRSFCEEWGIAYPLHSVEIRNSTENFTWLGDDKKPTRAKFLDALNAFLLSLPVTGIACVINWPGYDARYRTRYGRQGWKPCKTAFSIAVERAAKATKRFGGTRMRVLPEECSRKDDRRLSEYYEELRSNGCPFDVTNSAKYQPLSGVELRDLLFEFRIKKKSSQPVQLADLFLWPMAQGGYDANNRAYVALKNAGKLIDNHLSPDAIPEEGIKYSCFD